MKISVIVPVFNVKDYVENCIQSILNQTYIDLEIILVNDGSTDGSDKICDLYAQKDTRIKVIHKQNGGLSSARNAGIEVAKGDLISFIDSDDWIESDFFEILYKGFEMFDVDISVVQFKKIKDYKDIDVNTQTKQEYKILSRYESFNNLFTTNNIGYSAVNKLYKKALFDEIKYPEGILMEDKAIIYKLLHKIEKISINSSEKYHYYLRQDSIMRLEFNEKNLISLDIHEDMIEFIKLNYTELTNKVKAKYVHTAIRNLIVMIKYRHSKKENYNRCIDIIKENIGCCMLEKTLKKYTKILAIVIYVCPFLPHLLVKWNLINKLVSKISIS